MFAVIAATLMTYGVAAQQPVLEPVMFNEQTGVHTFTISRLPEIQRSRNFIEPPFYNFFCLFGDGEYAPLMDYRKSFCWENYTTQNNTSIGALCQTYPCPLFSNSIGHIYNVNAKYVPLLLAMDRKGDTPPPVALRFRAPSLPVSLLYSRSVQRVSTMPPDKLIYLAHSHGYFRNKDSSIFIISYKGDDCLTHDTDSTKVHLFYGRKRLINGQTYVRSAHFTDRSISHNPTYGRVPEVLTRSETETGSPFSNHDVFDIPNGYIAQVHGVIGKYSTEQRLFREVRHNNVFPERNDEGIPDSYLGTVEWSYAMAVLTSSSKTCKKVDDIDSYLSGVPGYDSVKKVLDGLYVIDVDTIHLKSGEPDDPNHLKIVEVCTDGSIRLRLTFSNEEKRHTSNATGATVDFKILDPDDFVWCKVEEVIQYEGKNVKWEAGSIPQTSVQCPSLSDRPKIVYDCDKKALRMSGILWPGGSVSVDIVLKAVNKTGKELLSTNYLNQSSLLEATVKLCPNAAELKLRNQTLDPVSPEKGAASAFFLSNCQNECQSCKKNECLLKKWYRKTFKKKG